MNTRLMPFKCVVVVFLSCFLFLSQNSIQGVEGKALKKNAHQRKDYLTRAENLGISVGDSDDFMHSFKPNLKFRAGSSKYEESTHWSASAQMTLGSKLKERRIETEAKNVILFLGDGMSVSTVTAARILKGQLEGLPFGEEGELNMEKFGNIGISKTFCSDSQTPDSACSATAYLSGVKANIATIGVTTAVSFRDCTGQQNISNHAQSVLAWAQAEGKSTGIITTTRVTHASPAGTYAHIADRDWENDYMIANSGENPSKCDDIGEQLILGPVGSKINVILGGGRRELIPNTQLDYKTNQSGRRRDGKNLIKTWIDLKKEAKARSKYITSRRELLNVNASETDYLLGLFAYDHMDYVTDANAQADPSLPEMTKVAIDILSKNPKGFFLFVEGGRIDHAHHSTKAQKALVETISMDAAIATAVDATSEDDTLIVVTADHSHVMTMSGYPQRGNPILGFAGISDVDDLPYTSLSYANGPGFKSPEENGERYDLTNDNLEHPDYTQMTGLPLLSETHGGDDVAVYARGPFAHLLTGVFQQSYIPHVMGFASCMGAGLRFCENDHKSSTSTSTSTSTSSIPGINTLNLNLNKNNPKK